MSEQTKRRTNERYSGRCTDRYSDRQSERPTVAEVEVEIEIEASWVKRASTLESVCGSELYSTNSKTSLSYRASERRLVLVNP